MRNTLDKISKFYESHKIHIIMYSIFFVSTVYTILLFTNQAVTREDKALQAIVAIAIETAKYTLPAIVIVGIIPGINKKANWFLRLFALILSIGCFYYSIMATKAYQTVQINQSDSMHVQNNPEYIRLNDLLKNKKDQLKIATGNTETLLRNDKDTNDKNIALINQLNADIKTYQKQIETKTNERQKAANKGQWGTYNRLDNEIRSLNSNINSNRSQLSNLKPSESLSTSNDAKITVLNNDISKINDDIKKVKESSGYNVLFDNPAQFKTFLSWLAVLIEFIGIYFSVIIGLKNDASNSIMNAFGTGKLKPNLQLFGGSGQTLQEKLDANRKNRVKSHGENSNDSINDELLKRYGQCMRDTVKPNGQCISYTDAAKLLGIKPSTAQACREILISRNILRKDDKRNLTYLRR